MGSCKDECETLMSAVLPVAEQMLAEHHDISPFGSTLSAADQIVQVGAWSEAPALDHAALIVQFQESFRDGAGRGELKATALVYATAFTPPGMSVAERAVVVQLDHRDDYSLVVTFPYRFSDSGDLVIEEPSAAEGEHKIFEG